MVRSAKPGQVSLHDREWLVVSSQVYLKPGLGAACAGQTRVAAWLVALSRVVTLSSDGNLGPDNPTGSDMKRGENAVMSDRDGWGWWLLSLSQHQ